MSATFAAILTLVGLAVAEGRASPPDILVITSPALEKGLTAWKAYRERQGHRVRVVVIAPAAAATGADRQRTDLIARIRQERPGIVLLAGNVAHVPTFRFESKKLGKSCESDQAYGLPAAGTGEPTLQVGRIPAPDAESLAAALAKVVRYESRFLPGEERNTIQFLAGTGGFGPVADGMIEAIATRMLAQDLDAHYLLKVIYALPTSPYFLPQADFPKRTREAFEAGPLIVVYAGHGNDRRFAPVWHRSVSRYFGVEDALDLAASRYPIFFATTCNTGDFERADQPGLCASLALEPHGPVATFGSSEPSQPVPNLLLDQALLAEVANGRPATLGDAIAALRADFQERSTPLSVIAKLLGAPDTDMAAEKELHQYLYNLFGDPATRLRFPRKDIELSARIDGDELRIRGKSPTVRSGTAVIRLDIDRAKLMDRVLPVTGKGVEEETEILRRNHAMASNKTLARLEVPIREGVFAAALPQELAARRRIAGKMHTVFFLRVYAYNSEADAVGSLEYHPVAEEKR